MNPIKKVTGYAGRSALPYLAAIAIIAAACGGKALPSPAHLPSPAATYTTAQRNSMALDVMTRHFTKYYNSMVQFFAGQAGYTDYKVALLPMIQEVGKLLPDLPLGLKDADGSIDKLSEYFKSHNVLIVPSVFAGPQDAMVKQVIIANVLGKESIAVDGKELQVVDYGNIRVKTFIENIDPRGGEVQGFTDFNGIYINDDNSKALAERQWNRFERNRELWKEKRIVFPDLSAAKPTEDNIGLFRKDLRLMLNDAEYADLYLANIDNNPAFALVYKKIKRALTIAHEEKHLKNRGKLEHGIAEDEASATYAELMAAKTMPPEFMFDGYAVLGETLFWITSPSPYPKAASIVFECYGNTILNNREQFPSFRLEEIDPSQKFALEQVISRFTRITKDEIVSLAEQCDRELSKPKPSTSINRDGKAGNYAYYPGFTHPHGSTQDIWRRNETRFSMDLRSRTKAYSRA